MNVDIPDAGKYKCEVENRCSSKKNNVKIIVKGTYLSSFNINPSILDWA
jgi:hypothetical protein